MIRFALALILALLCGQVLATEYPTVNVPQSLRQSNWLGSQGEGSCVHASFISLLRWQQRYNTADWWRKTHGNGEWPTSMNQQLDAAKIRYAVTTDGDVAFLEWAMKTRRGAVITWSPAHAVTLVHLDAKRAGILNNNSVNKIIWQDRDAFIREWRSRGGWAFTPIYTPAPPLPTK